MSDLRTLIESIAEQDAAVKSEKKFDLSDDFIRHIMIYILHVSTPPFEANWSTFSLRFNEYFLNRRAIFSRFNNDPTLPVTSVAPLDSSAILDRLADSESLRASLSKELGLLRNTNDSKDLSLTRTSLELATARSELARANALLKGSVHAEFEATKAAEAKIAELERRVLTSQAKTEELEHTVITLKKQNSALRVVVEANLKTRMQKKIIFFDFRHRGCGYLRQIELRRVRLPPPRNSADQRFVPSRRRYQAPRASPRRRHDFLDERNLERFGYKLGNRGHPTLRDSRSNAQIDQIKIKLFFSTKQSTRG